MNAYAQPPQYGYGMPPQNAGSARGSAGLAKAALAVLGIRIFLSLVSLVTTPIIMRSVVQHGGMKSGRAFYAVQQSLFGVVVFVAALLFMLFVRSEIVALRASGIATKYTPGWAVGWWFIPFANFVMPLLVVLDVWKYRLPRAGGALPVLWWVAYVLSIVSTNVPIPVPYLGFVIALAAYGLWAALTFMLMNAPPPPQPYFQQQPSYPPPPAQPTYGYYPQP